MSIIKPKNELTASFEVKADSFVEGVTKMQQEVQRLNSMLTQTKELMREIKSIVNNVG